MAAGFGAPGVALEAAVSASGVCVEPRREGFGYRRRAGPCGAASLQAPVLGVGGTGPLRGQPRGLGALCSLSTAGVAPGVAPGGFWPLVRSQSPEPPPWQRPWLPESAGCRALRRAWRCPR